MEGNKKLRSTWIMVTSITAVAFIIGGLIQLKYDQLVWEPVMKFTSALVLLLYMLAVIFRSKRIFKTPALYFILFFVGFVLILVGSMTTINQAIWGAGVLFLLVPVYLAFRKEKIDIDPDE